MVSIKKLPNASSLETSSAFSRAQLLFLLCVALIFSLGLLMVFDTTSAEVLDRSLNRSTHQVVLRQLAYAFMGGLSGWLVWRVGYRRLLQRSALLFWMCSACLLLVFVPPFGHQINGAHRWLQLPGLTLQPSEFAKFLIPLWAIEWLCSHPTPTALDFYKGAGVMAIPMGLILCEPDNGSVAILLATLVALFVLVGLRWTYWVVPLCLACGCGAALASRMPHVSDRIFVYLHPERDLKGRGHQPYQAKIAAGSGALWGRGAGHSLQKLDYLPEARSDYIAAIFAEEFGFVGVVALILLYASLALLGYRFAMQSTDLRASLLIATFTFLICFQAFINLAVVSGLLPSKGTNLPFFSHGGSSLIANLMATATMLQASRVHAK